MRQVPLSGRVIFSDWHGLLSRDPFWTSIRGSATHPLHAQLEAGMAGVLASDPSVANEWMKGLLSSDQVIAGMGIQLNGRFRDDFLARRLDLDCARMQVNVGVFEVLRTQHSPPASRCSLRLRWPCRPWPPPPRPPRFSDLQTTRLPLPGQYSGRGRRGAHQGIVGLPGLLSLDTQGRHETG